MEVPARRGVSAALSGQHRPRAGRGPGGSALEVHLPRALVHQVVPPVEREHAVLQHHLRGRCSGRESATSARLGHRRRAGSAGARQAGLPATRGRSSQGPSAVEAHHGEGAEPRQHAWMPPNATRAPLAPTFHLDFERCTFSNCPNTTLATEASSTSSPAAGRDARRWDGRPAQRRNSLCLRMQAAGHAMKPGLLHTTSAGPRPGSCKPPADLRV